MTYEGEYLGLGLLTEGQAQRDNYTNTWAGAPMFASVISHLILNDAGPSFF